MLAENTGWSLSIKTFPFKSRFNFSSPTKAPALIVFIFGISTVSNKGAFSNAETPIVKTSFIITLVKLDVPLKALSPISVTLDISIVRICKLFSNAELPIFTTGTPSIISGITNSEGAVFPSFNPNIVPVSASNLNIFSAYFIIPPHKLEFLSNLIGSLGLLIFTTVLFANTGVLLSMKTLPFKLRVNNELSPTKAAGFIVWADFAET